MTIYQLRPYQSEAVQNTVSHFKKTDDAAVIVLPTGAGKSLVIAELARIAKRKILVLAHVKELVEQNSEKYKSYGLEVSIFSAGLKQKSLIHQVTFASIQSIAKNLDKLDESYSLVIIDECHRVNLETNSQYAQVINQLKTHNTSLKVLGLTATPYRMGIGWIYHEHYHGFVRGSEDAPFKKCIYELPLRYMIKNNFLTPPNMIDAAINHYDFSSIPTDSFGRFDNQEMSLLLKDSQRVTKAIVDQIVDFAQNRLGVMIFASTIEHAKEILTYLPQNDCPKSRSALVIGDTELSQRDRIITEFKQQKIKFLVNVSVLTTGFDAPHVDFIAILRPTESVSLYQQIVGRGLRLSENKDDCLVIDYAGNGYDIFYPEVGSKKPDSESEPVQVLCPGCGFANMFWGKTDNDGKVIEHFGRRCQGMLENDDLSQQCDFRFRFKQCDSCGAENDIAARKCHECGCAIVDPDDKLKAALNLKDALVLRCSGMQFEAISEFKIKITYFDEDGASCDEVYNFENSGSTYYFNQAFGKRLLAGQEPTYFKSLSQAMDKQAFFRAPDFVIARKMNKKNRGAWRIVEKLFDYEGNYRKANQI